MGNVKDRYLQHQAAGDQVCGCTVSRLDVNSEQFSVSPPHFVMKSDVVDGCDAKSVDEAIDTVFGSVPHTWKMLSWLLLASLIFHRSWLEDTVKKGSRLHGCVLFQCGVFDSVLPVYKDMPAMAK
jgi:hypothetical protein